MKSHLIYTFMRLALVALLISGNSLSARGHDLPQDRNLPPAASANCFASFSPQHFPCSNGASPWLFALQEAWSSTAQAATLLQESLHNLSSKLSDTTHLSANTPAIHAPDPGIAPRPRLNTATAGITHAVVHSADNLLVHRPAAGTPPRPRFASAHRLADELAWVLSQLDSWQCEISQALYDQDALQQAIAAHTQRTYRQVNLALAGLTRGQSSPERITLAAGPQFVVFDTTAGQQILLTVAQARQWQFASSAPNFDAAEWLRAAVVPLQQQAVWSLSRNLESAGNRLIQLARSISNLAPITVAEGPAAKQWK